MNILINQAKEAYKNGDKDRAKIYLSGKKAYLNLNNEYYKEIELLNK